MMGLAFADGSQRPAIVSVVEFARGPAGAMSMCAMSGAWAYATGAASSRTKAREATSARRADVQMSWSRELGAWAGGLLRHHDVGRLDHRDGLVADLDVEVVDGLVGD